MKKLVLYTVFCLAIIINGCGEKLDLSQFPITNNNPPNTASDTVYIQQSPSWNQFNNPSDIYVGREPLIYVADTKNNRVVQMDISGAEIGTMSMLNPVAITQDRNLDLLVIADSALTTSNDTISIVYRIKLFNGGGIISNSARISYLASDYPTPLTSRKRKFTGIDVYPDNSIILTRIGPNNSSSIDPDNAILRVSGNSSPTVSTLTGFQTTGNGIFSIEKTSSIITYSGSTTDFILTRNTPDFGFKVEWFVYDITNGSYDAKFLPDENVALVKQQFASPEDVTLDNNKNIFVIDEGKDSLYKFNRFGSRLSESFGGNGSGTNKLNHPKGVAFFNKTLYIADTGNNRIVRYKLSTDIQ